MTDYALFANARQLAFLEGGMVAVQSGTPEADKLRGMSPADRLVLLFDETAVHGDAEHRSLVAVCEELDVDPAQLLHEYENVAGSVPFILTVSGTASEQSIEGESWVSVPVEEADLQTALPANDFLRLRQLSDSVAAKFKGSVVPGGVVQEVSSALVSSVHAAVAPGRDEDTLFRRFSLVVAQTVPAATELLVECGRTPREGDLAFLVTPAAMSGLVTADVSGQFNNPAQPISRSPEDVKTLLIDAQQKATAADPFDADPAIRATEELIGLLSSDKKVKSFDDFRTFYSFRKLASDATQAIRLAKRPMPPSDSPAPNTKELTEEDDVAAALLGLSVEAVLAELPESFSIERSVVAAAVASMRAGKHLLLGGPPGTGKTTLAEALCRAVVHTNYDVTTATADWTTFDTIGGYLPDNQGLTFSPGVVLRSLRASGWLIIDEINRADIDKAFGPLFTVLSGGEGSAGRTSVLPYANSEGKPITIEWALKSGKFEGNYIITPSWRLIGTLNVSDKASLFRLSFAFLRRFAVIDIPIPVEDDYRKLFENWFAGLNRDDTSVFVDQAMAIMNGPVRIGPAIGRDFAKLIVEGLTETASGTPTFENEREAVLTAVRLLVAPQYEGQPLASGNQLLDMIAAMIDTREIPAWGSLKDALHEVALS